MQRIRTGLTAAGAVLWTTLLWGHPGHGVTPPDAPAHYVIEPVHLAPVIGLLAAIALGLVVIRRNRVR